jgi:signal transduction histidine kinase
VKARFSPDLRYLAAAIAATLAVIAGALFLVDATVERTLDREEERAARRELSLLEAVFNDKGGAGVIDAITRREQIDDDGSVVALKDDAGGVHGGNLAIWPDEQRDDRSWGEFTLTRDDGPSRAKGLQALLPDGSIALVANDLTARDRIRHASLAGFALALALVTAFAMAAGARLSRRARMRAAMISRTAEEVMAGRLHARVPVVSERDVFDHLGAVVNQMLDRIEVLFAAMRAVTDSLAHDLRTPLNRLSGALERAAAQSQGHPEALSEIERAQGEASRLAATFAALIDIARAESGLSEEAMELVDLKALIESLTDLFAPSAEDRGASISVSAPALMLRVHRPLLQQAIGNLIDNAVKFAPPGGVIAITLKAIPEGAEILVADSGAGMSGERRARAGERFSPPQPEQVAGKGAGLGLSIVAATARLHKGELTLEDNLPGLRARLTLRSGEVSGVAPGAERVGGRP